jgi:hypothetical protein
MASKDTDKLNKDGVDGKIFIPSDDISHTKVEDTKQVSCAVRIGKLSTVPFSVKKRVIVGVKIESIMF